MRSCPDAQSYVSMPLGPGVAAIGKWRRWRRLRALVAADGVLMLGDERGGGLAAAAPTGLRSLSTRGRGASLLSCWSLCSSAARRRPSFGSTRRSIKGRSGASTWAAMLVAARRGHAPGASACLASSDCSRRCSSRCGPRSAPPRRCHRGDSPSPRAARLGARRLLSARRSSCGRRRRRRLVRPPAAGVRVRVQSPPSRPADRPRQRVRPRGGGANLASTR